MHTLAFTLIHNWRVLLLLAVIPALANCSRIDGNVGLNNSDGASYFFAEATVKVFDLNSAAVLLGQARIPKGLGSVDSDGSTIELQVITATIDDGALYSVEIRCPAGNATDACNVESPLHVVLSGAQLKASGWNATVLGEIAFQNIAYYAKTEYSTDEISRILENNASALLIALPGGVQKTYADLLARSATDIGAVKRIDQINAISELLAAGISDSDLKVLAQQAVSAELSSFNLSAYPAIDGWIVNAQLSEGYVYFLGEGMPVTIVDIRDPNMIAPVGTVNGHIHNVPTVSGDFLYAMGSAEWDPDQEVLYIVDISDRQHPQTIGQLASPYSTTLAASGRYVYAGIGDSGIADAINVIDTTNLTTLTVVGTLNVPHSALLVSGDRLYATLATQISIIDISTPSTPIVAGSLTTPRPASNITTVGDYIYVTIPGAATSDPVQVQVVDVSNPAAPTISTELTLATGTTAFTVVGTRAYADTSTTTQILDISDPAAPVLADSFPNEASGIRLNDFAFFSYGDIVSITDLSILSQPVVQSASVPLEGVSAGLVAATDRYAYMPNRSEIETGFKIFDLIDPLVPQAVATYDDYHFFGPIMLADNYALVSEPEYGSVEILDMSNPLEPVLLGRVGLDDGPFVEELPGVGKVALSGNTILAPWKHQAYDGGDGIGYGEWDCNNSNPDGDVGGLVSVDASTLAAPVVVGHICTPEGATAVVTSGNYAYVAAVDGSLQVIDFTVPAQLLQANSVDLIASANSIAVVGGYLWVTEGDAGIEIFNISNPAAPVLLTHIAVPGDTSSIEVKGNHVYVAAGMSGVHIFDIGNPALPRLVGNVSTDLAALSVFVEGDYLYAATSAGLEIFKALPGNP